MIGTFRVKPEYFRLDPEIPLKIQAQEPTGIFSSRFWLRKAAAGIKGVTGFRGGD